MSYCSNCGGRLNDQGLCPNCGGMSEASVKPKQKNDSEVLRCLKDLFSASPLKGVEKAARTQSASVWVTFGAAYFIAATSAAFTAITTVPSTLFQALWGDGIAEAVTCSQGDASDAMLQATAKLLGCSAGLSLLSLALVAVVARLMFCCAEEKPSLTQALNITAFAALPLTISMLLANPLTLLSLPCSISLLLFGLVVSTVLFYFGVQKASFFKKSPFPVFLFSSFGAILLLQGCAIGMTVLLF